MFSEAGACWCCNAAHRQYPLAPVCKEHNVLRWCIYLWTEASGRSVADKRPGGKQRRNCLVAEYNVRHNSLQRECSMCIY